MNKRFLLPISLVVGIAALIVVTGVFAGTEVKDVIRFENEAYKKHKRPITVFSHKKHHDELFKKIPGVLRIALRRVPPR